MTIHQTRAWGNKPAGPRESPRTSAPVEQDPPHARSAGRADALPGTADFHRSGAQLSEDMACVQTPEAEHPPAGVKNQTAEQ